MKFRVCPDCVTQHCKKLVGNLDDISPDQLSTYLETWHNSPFGGHLLAQQQATVGSLLQSVSGYRALELVVGETGHVRDSSPQLHKCVMAASPQQNLGAICEFFALPLPSNVVDVTILNHVLDYCELPHESLKEAARVVLPSGYLVIIGFNPFSLFGLMRWLMRLFSPALIWRCRALAVPRVVDWLKLLGFQCEKIVYGAYNPPVQSRGFLAKMAFAERLGSKLQLPVGAYYVIVAKKQRVRHIGKSSAWLAKAINPVKLNPESRVKPTKNGTSQ